MHTGTHIYMNIGSHTPAHAHTGIHTHQGNKDINFSFNYNRILFSFG